MIPVYCDCGGISADCLHCDRRVRSCAALLEAEELDQALEVASADPGLVVFLTSALLSDSSQSISPQLLRASVRIAPFLRVDQFLLTGRVVVVSYFNESAPVRSSHTGAEVGLLRWCYRQLSRHFPDDPFKRERAR